MQNIRVNATGCGGRKSTYNRELIKENTQTRYLVIVPSLALADEYSECGTVINSGNTKNVQQQLSRALEVYTRVIVITQAAFLNFPNKRLLCDNRTVIQDEHLEVFTVKNWRMDNHLDWLPMFVVTPTEFDGWYRVSVNTTLVDDFLAAEDMFDDKQMINDLLATPHLLFTNTANLQPESRLFRTISPEVYAGADAVHIACANFTATRQYQIWSRLYGVLFDVTQPFERYVTPNLTVHYAEQTYNSKTFNGKDSTIRESVIAHIEQRCADPVYVDNNCHDDRRGWQRVDHNCHGVNQYRDEQHIAFLSAINYNNLDSAFLQDVVGMDNDEVRHSLVGEMAHQVLMRGALRGNNAAECHVYVMEAALAAYLLTAIFSGAQECVISDTNRPQKKPPISSGDRKKACHIRRRLSQYKDMSTRDLMNDPIWHLTGSNGQDIKPLRLVITESAEA